ncbi:hypothetical protein [Halalkalibaculum sp. DA384]|uniref:hypothetical protein n=1 Tax=Halalkalibaculum sp. DA384 TaxID=3373606 RepID=UPI0037548114
MILFLSAWSLQSLSPVLTQQLSHSGSEVMVCEKPSNNGTTCEMNGTNRCNCSHHSSDNTEHDNTVTICGCTHHGNEVVGIASPFQIKAPLVSAFGGISFSPTSILPGMKQHRPFIFTEDIFHPPRPTA